MSPEPPRQASDPRPIEPERAGLLQLARTLVPYAFPYRYSILGAYACLVPLALTEVLAPWPLKLIVDHVILAKPLPENARWLDGLAVTLGISLLGLLSLAIVLVALVEGTFYFLNRYLVMSANLRIVNDIRRSAFRHLQSLSTAVHQRARSGDLVVRLTEDVEPMGRLVVQYPDGICRQILTASSVAVTMMMLDVRVTLVALSITPALVLTSAFFSRRIREATRRRRRKASEIASLVTESVAGLGVVKAFVQERREADRFGKESEESLDADLQRVALSRLFTRVTQLEIALGVALVVWYAAGRALAGDLLPGTVIAFVSYVSSLYTPIGRGTESAVDLLAALSSAERIAQVFAMDQTVADRPGAAVVTRATGAVRFESVAFGYRPGEPVVSDVSFEASPGEVVAIVGPSGAGKSTLVSLLLRFHDPWSGRITLDGRDLRDVTLRSLREQLAVVMQDCLVFRQSVRENISYGREGATDGEIVGAAELAAADGFIRALPVGYDTVLDERGQGLSGGQRQRLAIARALVKNAPVLIFDEPTAGLDAALEAEFDGLLERLRPGRTIFLVAHRSRSIAKANRIVVLAGGRVAAIGTHPELLATSEEYRRAAGSTTEPIRDETRG